MKLNKVITPLLCALVFSMTLTAQNFMPAFSSFSKKKTSYVTMENGEVKKGNIKDFDWKKGLIEQIKLLDEKGNKVKIKPEAINFMYLPPSGWAKYASTMDFLSDATKWNDTDLDKDIIGKGYAYMEKSEVRIKKKTRTLIVQLINPSFSNKIKVYQDPISGETPGFKPGGINVVGGLAKSYFVKKAGDKVAFELHKKNYDEEFKLLFGDCKELMKKYGSNPKWADFEMHVYEYSNCGK